jgi:LPXTG-site transpeptidase (sortase) family protein
MKILRAILFISGIVCLLVSLYLFWERTNPERLSFVNPGMEYFKTGKGSKPTPVRMIILKQNIDLPVFPAELANGKWPANKSGISYLVASPVPGEKGNSILYGHNFPNLLGHLSLVRPGDTIEIRYNDGSAAYFVIVYLQTVSPSDTSILDQTDDYRLTLYTCTGFLDSKRFVVVAELKHLRAKISST